MDSAARGATGRIIAIIRLLFQVQGLSFPGPWPPVVQRRPFREGDCYVAADHGSYKKLYDSWAAGVQCRWVVVAFAGARAQAVFAGGGGGGLEAVVSVSLNCNVGFDSLAGVDTRGPSNFITGEREGSAELSGEAEGREGNKKGARRRSPLLQSTRALRDLSSGVVVEVGDKAATAGASFMGGGRYRR